MLVEISWWRTCALVRECCFVCCSYPHVTALLANWRPRQIARRWAHVRHKEYGISRFHHVWRTARFCNNSRVKHNYASRMENRPNTILSFSLAMFLDYFIFLLFLSIIRSLAHYSPFGDVRWSKWLKSTQSHDWAPNEICLRSKPKCGKCSVCVWCVCE